MAIDLPEAVRDEIYRFRDRYNVPVPLLLNLAALALVPGTPLTNHDADRVAQRELEHREPDADARRPYRDGARERNRIAVHALAREVVLREPEAVEARASYTTPLVAPLDLAYPLATVRRSA